MIIDAHAHIGEMNRKNWTADQLIAAMDEAAIDYSLVIAYGSSGEPSSTEKIIEACKNFDRLKVIGNVDFSTFDAQQLSNLICHLKEKKIYGVKFYLGYDEYLAADPKLFPLYEFCQENGYPVIFHTGVLETGFSGLLKYSHPLNVDEVANKFPNLKIVIAHMGNPWILDCLAVVLKNPNVYVDCSAYFTEYKPIKEEDVGVFIKQLTDAKVFIGDFKRFLFGTDWPLYNQKEYLEAVKGLPMTDEEKELVFWKNAKEVFNLKM